MRIKSGFVENNYFKQKYLSSISLYKKRPQQIMFFLAIEACGFIINETISKRL